LDALLKQLAGATVVVAQTDKTELYTTTRKKVRGAAKPKHVVAAEISR
jgi:hypothetical protein